MSKSIGKLIAYLLMPDLNIFWYTNYENIVPYNVHALVTVITVFCIFYTILYYICFGIFGL